MREIETKYRVADAESVLAALRSAGVAMGGPILQDDQTYAPAGWTPDRGKIGFTFVRVRTQDNTHLLTTKTPLSNSMECAEYETGVTDRAQTHGALVRPAVV